MNSAFGSKKGFSPLIATVLLIAFAVALGAVIISSFQERLPDEEASGAAPPQRGCDSGVQIAISELEGVSQLCYAEQAEEPYLHLNLENTGETDVKQIHLGIHGSDGIYTNKDLDATKMVAGVGGMLQKIPYSPAAYGSIERVIITPVVESGGSEEVCSGSSIRKEISEIRIC